MGFHAPVIQGGVLSEATASESPPRQISPRWGPSLREQCLQKKAAPARTRHAYSTKASSQSLAQEGKGGRVLLGDSMVVFRDWCVLLRNVGIWLRGKYDSVIWSKSQASYFYLGKSKSQIVSSWALSSGNSSPKLGKDISHYEANAKEQIVSG